MSVRRWFGAAALVCAAASGAMAQERGDEVQQQQQVMAPPALKQVKPEVERLVGKLIKKPWSKTAESWDAGGSDYYVLDVGDAEVKRRSAAEGVILRASDAVSAQELERHVGERVSVTGVTLPDTEYKPDPMEQHPVSMDGGPIMRAGGFQVLTIKKIKEIKSKKVAPKP